MLISLNQLQNNGKYFVFNKENESNNENEELLKLLSESKEIQSINIDQLYTNRFHPLWERLKEEYPSHKLTQILQSETFLLFD